MTFHKLEKDHQMDEAQYRSIRLQDARGLLDDITVSISRGLNVYTNHGTSRQPVIPESAQATSVPHEGPMLSELSDQTTIPQVMERRVFISAQMLINANRLYRILPSAHSLPIAKPSHVSQDARRPQQSWLPPFKTLPVLSL